MITTSGAADKLMPAQPAILISRSMKDFGLIRRICKDSVDSGLRASRSRLETPLLNNCGPLLHPRPRVRIGRLPNV